MIDDKASYLQSIRLHTYFLTEKSIKMIRKLFLLNTPYVILGEILDFTAILSRQAFAFTIPVPLYSHSFLKISPVVLRYLPYISLRLNFGAQTM